MSKNHIKALSVSNYRGFKALKIDGVTKLNVIGGMNGIGKSSLLEAIFHIVDRGNPTTLFRPYQWRQIPLAPSDNIGALTQVFHNRDINTPITLTANTGDGKLILKYTFGPQEISHALSQSVQQGELNRAATETAFSSSSDGFRITCTRNSAMEVDIQVQLSGTGLSLNLVLNRMKDQPTSVLLNSTMRGNDNGIPTRYSNLVKRGQEQTISEFLHLVHPEIKDLRLLMLGGVATLHADIGNGNWIPLPFLGEGAVSLASTVLAIADSTGGIVFLDEVDSTVHHSKLAEMWSLVLRSAKKFDTQVFAATHSNESLEALAESMDIADDLSDISYHRIRQSKRDIETSAVSYVGSALRDAVAQRWEIR